MPSSAKSSANQNKTQDNNAATATKTTPVQQRFAPRLLAWFEQHGRHDLPWQQHQTHTPDPYVVWLSEVMLQQTQVTTVIPYFTRFIAAFPNVPDLAQADWDEIASLWAGLGYYARARNLHIGAKQLMAYLEQHDGQFPQSVAQWQQIRGVGPSTAGAIVAMGLHQFGVICDGNVKRVLTRWAGIDGDISKAATNHTLWALAKDLTPHQHSGRYAQAIMDLGATVCTRRKPACLLCPVRDDCQALAQGEPTRYPVKAKKKRKPSKYSRALVLTNPQQQWLWLQRPSTGIWGGLWCVPLMFDKKEHAKQGADNKRVNPQDNTSAPMPSQLTDPAADSAEFTAAESAIWQWLEQQPTLTPMDYTNAAIKHSLTHFDWRLTPRVYQLTAQQAQQLTTVLHQAELAVTWQDTETAQHALALPKAMPKLIGEITQLNQNRP